MIRFNRNRARPGRLTAPVRLALLPVVAVLAGALVVSELAADFTLDEWPYFKPVVLPSGLAGGELVELILDREVYQDSAAGQPDLRLIKDGVQEVPYQLALAEGREERTTLPSELVYSDQLSRQYTSLVADLGPDDLRHNEVEVVTADANFQRETTVEGSADGQTWVVLREGTEIFDFTAPERDFNTRNTRIGYPESEARYLRVKVFNGGDPSPLDITGVGVTFVQEVKARETSYRPALLDHTEDADARASILTLDLGAPGIPASRLAFQTPAVNFHRDIAIAGSEDGETWQLLQAAAVYSYDTPRFDGSRMEVSYPESRYRYYRFTVENRDDPPLQLEEITLHGVKRQVIFQIEPGPEPGAQLDGEYALYYGNRQARQPSYDLERVVRYLETGNLPAATLGAQRDNPAFTAPQPPLTERYPWLIPVAVVAAALAVGLLLLGVVRQARKSLSPPSPPEA